MLTPEQIRRRAINRYEDFLRSLCKAESFFPLAIFGAGFPGPSDFRGDRLAIEALRKGSREQIGFGYAIGWKERNFRRIGAQKVPSAVSFLTRDDYLRFLDKTAEVEQFELDSQLIRQRCPELISWMQTKPLKVVANAGAWNGLLSVSLHLKENPQPNCYLRELPVVVDTKFVERHTGILAELLPIVAPMSVRPDESRFEARFGFRFKQPLVRLRFLDGDLVNRFGFPINDFATPLDQFSNLPLAHTTILIVENEMTFLSLPPLPGTVAVFGAGDAAALLSNVTWLAFCRVLYWGDLDSHGFETLAHLRKAFPSIRSVLMDSDTLEKHATFGICASKAQVREHLELTCEEKAVYIRLAENGILLEQERIPVVFSKHKLSQAVSP
jgi:hypothetical protein